MFIYVFYKHNFLISFYSGINIIFGFITIIYIFLDNLKPFWENLKVLCIIIYGFTNLIPYFNALYFSYLSNDDNIYLSINYELVLVILSTS